jgi:hypothetical protein
MILDRPEYFSFLQGGCARGFNSLFVEIVKLWRGGLTQNTGLRRWLRRLAMTGDGENLGGNEHSVVYSEWMPKPRN